jgi:HK97 family phage prohead protease
MKQKEFEISVKEAAEENSLEFEGYLSTYGNVDRDQDIIVKGAFTESIAKNGTVPLLFNHDRNSVMGKLELVDDAAGLKVIGTFNASDESAVTKYQLLKMGALTKMSVGMYIKDHEPVDKERPFGGWIIKDADVLEGSIVVAPANDLANITAVKELSESERSELDTLRLEKRLKKIKELVSSAKERISK